MKNPTMKAAVMTDMANLLNQLEAKLAVLDSLDRCVGESDCADLHDQLSTMFRSAERFRGALQRANEVNGVDAEYDNLFGETE
jgi:hypothetical protein